MGIYDKNTPVAVYKDRGRYKPVNLYVGHKKLAGWKNEIQSGQSLSFENTYDDKLALSVHGSSAQQSDYYAGGGASTQNGTPTPQAPVSITPYRATGTYKRTRSDGRIYEFTLTDDLRGLGASVDNVVIDDASGIGWRKNSIGSVLFAGMGDWSSTNQTDTFYIAVYNTVVAPLSSAALCTHLPYNAVGTTTEKFYISASSGKIVVYIFKTTINAVGITDLPTLLSKFKTWLGAQHAVGTPVTVNYVLATPVKTALTFTLVESSSAPELPMQFVVANTPSMDYPARVSSISADTITVGEQNYNIATTAPLYSLPDGTADDWSNAENETHNIGIKIFDGTNQGGSWIDRSVSISGGNGTLSWLQWTGGEAVASESGLCNILPIISGIANVLHLRLINGSNAIGFFVPVTTLDAFKAWLAAEYAAGRPVTVYYKKATPTVYTHAVVDMPTYPKLTEVTQTGLATLTGTAKVLDI